MRTTISTGPAAYVDTNSAMALRALSFSTDVTESSISTIIAPVPRWGAFANALGLSRLKR